MSGGRLRRARILGRGVVLASLLVLVLGLTGARSAPLSVFVVTTTADSGVGSLRQAILDANAAAGADTITFGIAGAGVHTIQPTTNFPNLTEAVTIDGTTESDYVVGDPPRIELDGTSAPNFPAFMITAPNVTIRGLTINRFSGSTAIQITAPASNTHIEASWVGLDATGAAAAGNANGIHVVSTGNTIGGPTADERNVISGNPGSALVLSGGSNTVQGNYVGTTADGLSPIGNLEGVGVLSNGNTIGGPNPGEGNVLSGSLTPSGAGAGVSFGNSAASNTVEGNLIGTNKDGTAAIPNSRRGIYFGSDNGANNVVRGNVISGNSGDGIFVAGNSVTIQGNLIGTNRLGTAALANGGFGIQVTNGSSANVIGGTAATAGNLISANNGSGIALGNSSNNQVFGNTIGTTAGGAPLPNASHGVEILFATGNVIGGEGSGEPNTIRSNSGDGVRVTSGTGHRVSANEIAGNGGRGIDLSGDGVTPNDAGDGDTGANDLQNFPVLTSATGGASTSVAGSLDTAAGTYRVEFFASSACDGTHGEGERFLGGRSISPGPFTATGLSASSAGELVTATATDSAGNTSEFSACQAVSGGGGGGTTFTVLNTSDSGAGSLRAAITAANAAAGHDEIEFDLDNKTISLLSPLPTITDPVDIHGISLQTGNVILDGTSSGGDADGLVLGAGSGGSTIEDLVIRAFSRTVGEAAAIRVESGQNHLEGNQLHDVDVGVLVTGASATGNVIGGDSSLGDGNTIWSYRFEGVRVEAAGTGNRLSGNTIGLPPTGPPAGGVTGVRVVDTPGTQIAALTVDDPPSNPAHVPGTGDLFAIDFDLGNVVVDSGEFGEGIRVEGAASTGTVIAGNFVGTDRSASPPNLGNGGNGIEIAGAANSQLGPGNKVWFNDENGILVSDAAGNRIVANSIDTNGGLGISLSSANGGIQPPNVFSATVDGTDVTIDGTFPDVGTPPYFVEFYSSPSCDPSTAGEGRTFLGFVQTVMGPFQATEADVQAPSLGEVVTATLTDSNGNTSEFSNCVTVEAGGGGAGDPPVLFGAVPNAVGSTLGVAGAWYSGTPLPGTTFDVAFYSVPACDPVAPKTPLGSRSGLVTNEAGIGAFAIDGLTNVAAGTIVVATVDGSAISNCVVADLNNTSWTTAAQLAPADTEPGFLRLSGEGRWFKVPVLPNSRVDVSISGLPADYDLVVFSDIQATYDRLVGGAFVKEEGPNLALDDLARQGAETPTDLYNTSQYNPSAMEPTNWDPELNSAVFSPTQFSPTQFSESLWSATIFSPTQFSPTQFSPTQFSPTQFSPTQFSPTQFSPTQFSPTQFSPADWATFTPADPRAFTSAQVASLVAVSANAGTGDEAVSVNTWNNTGYFYFRVQGKNGSFDPDTSFTLNVSRQGNLCSGVTDVASSPTAAASGRKTVILYDSSRLSLNATQLSKLSSFAGRPEVAGAVVDVGTHAAVSSLNAQADSNPSCPYAKNLVASAIKRVVDEYRKTNPIEYVVVVGGDRAIPFYRYPDPALLGNETMYVPPVADNTASQASLRLGYVLSDDFFGADKTVFTKGYPFPVPRLAIGRLVETPAEIEGMLDAYTGAGGSLSPQSSLVTGYDFLTDAADQIAGTLAPKVPGTRDETLITNQNVSPGTVTAGDTPDRTHSWTAADLRRELLAERHDVIFLAGHFSANDALAADYRTNVLTTELTTAPADLTNAVVFSAGCHAGYNIVDEHAITGATEPLDWAQAFARRKATLVAGTGYQYGDTDFLAHSERLYAEFAKQLGGPVGTSLLRSKQLFLEQTPTLSGLDEKAVLQATLFGLPMLNVNVTPSGPGGEPSVASPAPVSGGPGAELGLQADDLTVAPALTVVPKQLDGPSGTVATSYLRGPDEVAVNPTQPILPLESVNVTPPTGSNVVLRGVGFRSGSYTDTTGVIPLTAAPATELRGIHAPFLSDVFFPTTPWTTNYFGALAGTGGTQLHVTPAQHRSESPTMTRRQFSSLGLRSYYSGNVASYCGARDAPAPCEPGTAAVTPALAAPPLITGVDATAASGSLAFEVRVVGDPVAGTQGVWITWTIPPGGDGSGSWQSLDLQQDLDDATLWKGTLTTPTPAAVRFVAQAVDGVGHVTLDHNFGALYAVGAIPGPLDPGETPPAATTLQFTTGPPSTVRYGASFSVTVDLNGSGACSSVANKVVKVGFGGGSGIPVTTNASGTATVTFRAALSPGTYPLTATFGGDATCASSDVSTNVVVQSQLTTLTLAFPAATLTAATTPPTPLHQRNVTFVLRKTGVTSVYTGKTDPLGRVEIPQSIIQSLPAGTYTVDVYFNGVNVPGVIQLAPDDDDYAHSEAHGTREVLPFTGFLGLSNPPTLNSVKGGSAEPIKFSLGSNRGLNVFASGYPKTSRIGCQTGNPIGAFALAQSTRFRYDTGQRHYTYDWKTDKGWAGTCRQLVIRLVDGTERVLWFRITS